nr:unnamed protein product [Callosobruchus chinensis]
MFFTYQVVTCVISSLLCSTYVTLVTSLLLEIMIQLCMLERSLELMENDMDLKNCVQWHLDILVFVKKVQRFCGVGVTVVFLCGIFNICTSLALTTQANPSDLPFIFLYTGAMISIIYSHCWCGSEVTYQSEKISYAIYSSQWTNANATYMKLINIHILLTKQPLEIPLGGGTFSASLPVFVMVINFLKSKPIRKETHFLRIEHQEDL